MNGPIEHVHQDLLTILEDLENHMGFELTVTSGQRTEEHNASVGGVNGGEHTYDPAEGVDVLCKQSITRYKMVSWLLKTGIQRIGIGKDFVHIGIAEDKPKFVMWTYYQEKTPDTLVNV